MNVALKDGVSLVLVKPQWGIAWPIIIECYRDHGAKHCVITSCNDGKHGLKSLHGVGLAIDLRTHGIESPADLAAKIKDALGREFDVIFEGAGTSNQHIHVEWDVE